MTNGPSGNVSPGNAQHGDVDPHRPPTGAPHASPAPPAHPTSPPTPGSGHSGENDEVLRTIGELQHGLGGLRALQDQTARLGEELTRKRTSMAQEHARIVQLREECAAERAAVDALKRELQAGQSELDARHAEIQEAGEALLAVRQELERGRTEIAAAREELARERSRVEALGTETAARGAADAHEAHGQITELNERISGLEQQLEDEARAFTAKLTETTAAKASLEARLAALEAELQRARTQHSAEGAADDAAVGELRDRLALVEQAREELESQLADGAGIAADAMSWNARRRERLRRYKSLMQLQARKIVTAKEALAKRQAECEQMLSQRAKLQTAMEALRAAEKKITARQARTGAAATVFCAVGTLAIVAVLSWAVTSQVVPATYIASAVLEPDGRGVTLADADIESWQQYHEELATDAGMMEEAAARFRQRGIVSLGSAPELQSRFASDLSVQPREDGGVVFELRGQGAEKTARELDTFVTSLASVANASRSSRPDGAATNITQPAAAGSEPVEDKRLVYAGGIAGGGAIASALLGLVIWGRLAKSKRRYEEEQTLANALEELSWTGPGEAAVR